MERAKRVVSFERDHVVPSIRICGRTGPFQFMSILKRDIAYGNHKEQFARILMQDKDSYEGLAVMVHGGFWKQQYTIENTCFTSIAHDLVRRGFVVGLLEYRRREDIGGGYPGSMEDVVKGYQCVTDKFNQFTDRIVLMGHSVGATFALLLCLDRIQVTKRPKLCIAIAPIADLLDGFSRRLSDEGDAVELYMKCVPLDEVSVSKYQLASPSFQGSISGVESIVLVSGLKDTDVPPDMVTSYYTFLQQIHPNCFHIQTDEDHYQIASSDSKSYQQILQHILQFSDRTHRPFHLNLDDHGSADP